MVAHGDCGDLDDDDGFLLRRRTGDVATVGASCWNQTTEELRPAAEFATTIMRMWCDPDDSENAFCRNRVVFLLLPEM